MMQIFIPTYGRSTKQVTFNRLQDAGLNPMLVIQDRERSAYSDVWEHTHVLPPEIQRIAGTRQYILDELVHEETFVMVDDDLVFFKRREDDATKLRDITDAELFNAFDKMERKLTYGEGDTAFPHVGFAAREGANRCCDGYIENTRIMRVLGYHAPTLRDVGVRFDAMEVMEDFHVALTLLEAGCKNLILNDYAHNQAGSGAEGGCSHFRTPELHARNAELLASLHPKFVRVVEKTTKGAWGGGTRKDVNIQWKRAFASHNV
jgi:hypothetical protein